MNIQTFSIVAGNEACNARCPFCVAGMTPSMTYAKSRPKINWRNFDIAAKLAKQNGATTAMITGKGEPTLFPNQISEYLSQLRKHDFPIIELQTNALLFERPEYKSHLENWYDLGLSLIAISTVDVEKEKNKAVYTPHKEYMNLDATITKLHSIGYSTRLAMVMTRGNVETVTDIKRVISYAKRNDIAQLTVRPVTKPKGSRNDSISDWISEQCVPESQITEITDYLEANGTRLRELTHGGIVYDVDGQNICLTNCLTNKPEEDKMRQLIFFPDGKISYDWQYEGARIL